MIQTKQYLLARLGCDLQCVQSDKQTLCLRLRSLQGDTWLYLSWHPVSGRICTGPQPARGTAAEAFSFGELAQQIALCVHSTHASYMQHLWDAASTTQGLAGAGWFSLWLLSGEQVEATIKQLVLLDAVVPQPWERVVQLSFGVRPATPPTHHVFLEVMGR